MAGWVEQPLFDAHTSDFYRPAGTWPPLDESLVGDDELHDWNMPGWSVSSLLVSAEDREARAW